MLKPGEKIQIRSSMVITLYKPKVLRCDSATAVNHLETKMPWYYFNPGSIWTSDEFPWLLLLFIAVVIFLIWYLTKDKDNYLEPSSNNADLNANPITAGPPQIPGGINDQQVHGRYSNYAHHRFSNAKQIEVRNIRRGTLSGAAEVHYGDKTTRRINLQSVVGYAGEILVDGKEQTVYFLQGCGNDARAGNFMTGNELRFTPDAEILQNGTAVPVNPQSPSVNETSVISSGTEFHKQTTQVFEMLSKFIEKDEAKHKITVKFADGDRSSEFILESKFDSKKTIEEKTPNNK